MTELTIKQIQRALSKLEKGWPRSSGYMLYADGNAIRLYEGNPNDEGENLDGNGPAKLIESYKIPSDGGGGL